MPSRQLDKSSTFSRRLVRRGILAIASCRDELLFGGAGILKLAMILGMFAPAARREVVTIAQTPTAFHLYPTAAVPAQPADVDFAIIRGEAALNQLREMPVVKARLRCPNPDCRTLHVEASGKRFMIVRSGA